MMVPFVVPRASASEDDLMRIVLAGDSHLAYVRRDLPRIGDDVLNLAVGGAVVTDVLRQLTTTPLGPGLGLDVGAQLGADDVVVVSVGTNDAAPLPGVELDEFESSLDELVAQLHPAFWVFLAPPGVESTRIDPVRRSNHTIAHYAAAGAARLGPPRGRVVDSPTLLAPLGHAAFAGDGVHLSGAGYDVLLPAVAEACRP
ncbi:hypothetical protein BH11ACT8_BH11ACT8_13040 [soil metagenome]